MNAFLRRYKKGTDAVGAFLFALLLGTFILQIGARFIFGNPLSWTDEFVVVLYIWMILWAAALIWVTLCVPYQIAYPDLPELRSTGHF